MSKLAIVAAAVWGAIGILPVGCAQQPEPAKAAAGEFATAEDLLAALERADQGMQSLTADLVYDRTFELQGDRQVRKGKLYFENRGEKGRRFAIRFEELWIGDVVRPEKQVYIFDGQWLVEKNFAEKMMIKRQIVPPGETFDPLKIGEGPMPIPLGQKKADVLLRFAATLQAVHEGLALEAEAGAQERAENDKHKKHVEGATQVKLEPKADFVRETEFKQIRLWYRKDAGGNLLPVMARTVNRNGDVSVVQLNNVQVQIAGKPANPKAAIPPEGMDSTTPSDGWEVRVDEFRKHADGGN